MQKRINNRTLHRVLNVVLVVLIVLFLIEFNAYLSLLVTEKYEVESNIRSCPELYAKEKQIIHQKQNVRLLVMGISAFLGIITYVIKSFVKNKELEQTSCSKNAKAVNDALNEKYFPEKSQLESQTKSDQ